MRSYFAILLYLLFSTTFNAYSLGINNSNHALYISVLELSHFPTSQTAQLKIKIFANDLGDALQNERNQRISIDSLSITESSKEAILQYFSKHVILKINHTECNLDFDKVEKNGDSLWLYFHANTPSQWKHFYMKADYLMELFPTQSNIVSITNGSKKRFAKLSIDETSVTEIF